MLIGLNRYQQVSNLRGAYSAPPAVNDNHEHEGCGCVDTVTIDPNAKPNPKINVVLPESGTGFRTYNREPGGVDQVGLQSTIDFIEDLGERWQQVSEVPFQVGDISRQGGGPFPPHSSHRNGNDADLRPFRKDGAMEPTNINDPNYDRDRTRQFVQLVRELAPNTVVLFNDQVLIREGLTQHHAGHHNHLHLGLRNTTSQSTEGC